MPFSLDSDLFIRTKKQKLTKIITSSQRFKNKKAMQVDKSVLQNIIQPLSLVMQIDSQDVQISQSQVYKIVPMKNVVSKNIQPGSNFKVQRVQSFYQSCLKQSNIGINYMQIQKNQQNQTQQYEKMMIIENSHKGIKQNKVQIAIRVSVPFEESKFFGVAKAKSDKVYSFKKQNDHYNAQTNQGIPQKLFYSDQRNQNLKNNHFKQFFQFVADFKLMKIQSYHPILHKVQMRKTLRGTSQQQVKKRILNKLKESQKNSLDHSIKIRQSKNSQNLSLSIQSQLPQNRQEISQNKMSFSGSQSMQSQPNRKKQLENSVISLNVSNLQMEDESREGGSKKQIHENDLLCYQVMKQNTNLLIKSENNLNLFQSQNLSDRSASIQKTCTKLISYEDLQVKLANARTQNIHQGYYCNQCYVQPIVGNRYKCIDCQDYDLCEKCFQNQCWIYQNFIQNSPENQSSMSSIRNNQLSSLYSSIKRSKQGKLKQKLLLKKTFSDIQEEEEEEDESQLKSELEQIFSDNQQNQHVHIMELVLVSPLQNQLLRLSKVLRQTNTSNQLRMSHHLPRSQKNIKIDIDACGQNIIQNTVNKSKQIMKTQRSVRNSNHRQDLTPILQKIKKMKQLRQLSKTVKQKMTIK